MSRTYANKPSVGQKTGARPRAPQRPPGLEAQPEEEGQETQSNDRTPQWRGAYSVIPPNETKRRSISQKARQEEETYQQHKEKQKLGHVSYVGTVGGSTVTEDMARRRLHNENKSHRFQTQMQSYKDNQRKQENEEYEKKKREQRRKAESLTQRTSDRQATLDVDRRRKNEAFLRRLESK